jgi:hypothetical protein
VTLRFAVVYEAIADLQVATELADRVFVESIDWLDEYLLDHQRTWIREWSGAPLTWKRIKRSALGSGFKVRGLYDEQPAKPDARAAHRAVLYLRYIIPELAGILLIRDQDNQTERREGLEQARRKLDRAFPVVVGLAVVERECWVISGFDPKDQTEESRLAAERQRLGFDPRQQSEELTACKNDKALRSPKRVLRELCGGDHDRESRCWRETLIETLCSRGAKNGLGAYLAEVRDNLSKLIGHLS